MGELTDEAKMSSTEASAVILTISNDQPKLSRFSSSNYLDVISALYCLATSICKLVISIPYIYASFHNVPF